MNLSEIIEGINKLKDAIKQVDLYKYRLTDGTTVEVLAETAKALKASGLGESTGTKRPIAQITLENRVYYLDLEALQSKYLDFEEITSGKRE